MEKHTDDPSTCVVNGGYHCDEKAKRNWLGPWIGGGGGWKRRYNAEKPRLDHMRCTRRHRHESTSIELEIVACPCGDWVTRGWRSQLAHAYTEEGERALEREWEQRGGRERLVIRETGKDELAGEERMTACWHCSLESMAAWGEERFRREMRGAEASPSLSCSD